MNVNSSLNVDWSEVWWTFTTNNGNPVGCSHLLNEREQTLCGKYPPDLLMGDVKRRKKCQGCIRKYKRVR